MTEPVDGAFATAIIHETRYETRYNLLNRVLEARLKNLRSSGSYYTQSVSSCRDTYSVMYVPNVGDQSIFLVSKESFYGRRAKADHGKAGLINPIN
jgi:hypothetical protein